MLADSGFVRQQDRTWCCQDGRSIGEGVALALADSPFLRYLGIDPAQLEQNSGVACQSPDSSDPFGSDGR